MSTATLDSLTELVSLLPGDRRQVLNGELERAAMSEEEASPKDVLGQLDLFGLKALVEMDDHLKTATLFQIAEVYGISVVSLQRYIRAGELKATRFGRKYVVTIAELKRFLATSRLKKG